MTENFEVGEEVSGLVASVFMPQTLVVGRYLKR
jgi:hypothetical protein